MKGGRGLPYKHTTNMKNPMKLLPPHPNPYCPFVFFIYSYYNCTILENITSSLCSQEIYWDSRGLFCKVNRLHCTKLFDKLAWAVYILLCIVYCKQDHINVISLHHNLLCKYLCYISVVSGSSRLLKSQCTGG